MATGYRPARWGRAFAIGMGALSIALMLAGCGGGAATTVTQDDNNTTVTITQGSRLIVLLDARPGAFLWELEDLDQNILEFKRKQLIETDQPSRYGGNSHRELIFHARGPGTTRLTLEFASLEEDDDEIADSFELTVVVEP